MGKSAVHQYDRNAKIARLPIVQKSFRTKNNGCNNAKRSLEMHKAAMHA